MALKQTLQNIGQIDAIVEAILRAARIPGAALAITWGGETVFAKGYGYRKLEERLPMVARTEYPIASTTKAINATLLGMLVDEGSLTWDTPVQHYVPQFRLRDPLISAQVTVRDLLVMRTGLPRHDWLWIENHMSRSELIERLRYLELSANFRERFQYNNLTVTVAGHIAEVVTGKKWEELVQTRILNPIGMSSTGFAFPKEGNVTAAYHENGCRDLVLTRRLATELTAPSGGAMYSTVEDMSRWLLFNLQGGRHDAQQLIEPRTLAEIHSPQVSARTDPSCPTPYAAYGIGWFVDTYNGSLRISHGGYLHDVNSEVSLFPKDQMGIVSFTNFGCPGLARLINQHVYDFVAGAEPAETVQQKMAEYEEKVEGTRKRNSSARRIENTNPSHVLNEYEGTYLHPGYGKIEIHLRAQGLELVRNGLILPLDHWHYDAWVVAHNDLFEIHKAHVFDRASKVLFETDSNGEIAVLAIRLEPTVSPVRFEKQEKQEPVVK